jgi:Recombination endonuclease VII
MQARMGDMNDPGMTEIICTRCHASKPDDQFSVRKAGRRGRHSWCKQCCAEVTAQRYQATKPAEPATRRCTRCHETRPIELFGRRQRGGRLAWCNPCVARRQRDRIAGLEQQRDLAQGSIRCTRCQQFKPRDAFSYGQYWCKRCKAEDQRHRRLADPDRAADQTLRQKYGLTLKQYNERLAAQGGGCAICDAKPRLARLHVDHDHRCCPGKKTCGRCFRGIVCYPCNTKLSILESDSEFAVRMRAYARVEVVRL